MIASNRLDKLGLTRALAPRIKQMVSPEQALREYVPGLSIDASGYTRCPFHQEKTASLRVYPNRVYCYGCHFLGDSTAIVSKLFGLSALQAIEKLNADFRLGLPVGRPVTLREGLELQDRAKAAEAKVLADKEAHEAYLRRFEAKLELERRLFTLEDFVLPECQPQSDPEQPWPRESLWAWARKEIQTIRYRLDYEDYEV